MMIVMTQATVSRNCLIHGMHANTYSLCARTHACANAHFGRVRIKPQTAHMQHARPPAHVSNCGNPFRCLFLSSKILKMFCVCVCVYSKSLCTRGREVCTHVLMHKITGGREAFLIGRRCRASPRQWHPNSGLHCGKRRADCPQRSEKACRCAAS